MLAIRRAASRRASLVDAVAARIPEIPGMRTLVAWAPVADADLVHAAYCIDDADAASGAGRFVAALTALAWKMDAIEPNATKGLVVISLRDGPYRLRGHVQPGRRADCDGGRRQVVLSLEAAPAR